VRLLNGYGPTEAVVTATFEDVGIPRKTAASIDLGRPLAGRRVRIADRGGRLAPAGVPGELLLGGALALGYLHRPDLAAERFVPDPFAAEDGGEPGERLYRTGDLARIANGGGLEYLGRIDQQVKVRGFRIELGEIEAALLAQRGVTAAAVLAQGAALVAYVVSSMSEPELRNGLRQRLPDFMIPTAFVFLPSLPLTGSGKVDRKALATLKTSQPERPETASGREPRTPAETKMAAIFAEVLGLERVGATDDFFALGGHSLLATQVVTRVRAAFGAELPVRAVFEMPTVEGLAGWAEMNRTDQTDPSDHIDHLAEAALEELQVLSFAQQRLWFLDRLQPDNPFYNIAAAVDLAGRLDVPVLAAALSEVVRRHGALRTTFREVAGEPAQRIASGGTAALPVIDLQALPAATRDGEAARLTAAEARRPFDLERGPLLRTALLALARERHAILVTMHHIVSDGWSLGVLVRELRELYEAFHAGRPSPLPELPMQYADFAAWQRRHLAGERLEPELAWWRGQLAGMPQGLDLIPDRPRPAALGTRGAAHHFALEGEALAGLQRLARRQGATLFMTLLAGFTG